MYSTAMDSSLEGSTKPSGSSAIRVWARFYDKIGANMLCLNGNDPYSLLETIFLIMSFASFEAIRGISPKSTFNVYLPAISNFYIVNQVSNNFDRALNSKQVKFVKRGYLKIYHKIHLISNSRKMAFTLELVKCNWGVCRDRQKIQ